MSGGHFPVVNSYPGPTVCVDLDGTLAPHGLDDGPDWALVGVLQRLHTHGWTVVVWSARPAAHHPGVVAWLRNQLLDELVGQVALGVKPAADIFLDDKGLLPPLAALHEQVELARTRDPVAAWTRCDTTTDFRAEMSSVPENPATPGYQDDPAFRVTVALSGGLDSTTAWAMAEVAGLPVDPVYVDTGSDYSPIERAICADILGKPLPAVELQVDYDHHAHIDVGRNAVIIWTLAQRMTAAGQWGQLWFANNAGFSETPSRGGDKSYRFFTTMQQLLTLNRMDVHLANPVGAMGKVDMVAWWCARGRVTEALRTFSCFHPVEGERCGGCWACFRWYVAFMANGVDPRHLFSNGGRWTRETVGRVLDPPPGLTYAPGRLAPYRQVLALHPEVIEPER